MFQTLSGLTPEILGSGLGLIGVLVDDYVNPPGAPSVPDEEDREIYVRT